MSQQGHSDDDSTNSTAKSHNTAGAVFRHSDFSKGLAMKTTTRNILIALILLAVVAICASGFLPAQHIEINGEEFDGLAGVGLAFAGIGIALLAGVFALICTGFILASVSALLLLVVFAVICGVVFAALPFALPFLILAGIVLLLQRRKSSTGTNV